MHNTIQKPAFMFRLPDWFCPNKFFGRKKRPFFGEHYTFFNLA